MARPTKQGVDYFPLDVNMDTKFELIEAKHGIVGFAILIKLFQKIYSEGYFIEWSEEMALLFSKRNNVVINLINVIINDAIKYKIFDQALFENDGILTSNGIQRRFIDIIKRRKTDISGLPYIIVNNNSINVDNNSINVDEKYTKKSKEKERKEKEKENITTTTTTTRDENFKNSILEYFNENVKPPHDPNLEAARFFDMNELKNWEAAGGAENWRKVAGLYISKINEKSKNFISNGNNGNIRNWKKSIGEAVENWSL